MDPVDAINDMQKSGRVLIVDDDRTCRNTHRAILATKFDVITAGSGAEALQLCREHSPDLVLLDIDMPDMDGFETCRQLREWTTVPIIFATGSDSIEQHLKAYDAGGDDLLVKPLQSEILLYKTALAILHRRKEASLIEEKDSLQRMAMNFLSTMGQSGALLNFMRASIACRTHRDLAERLLNTMGNLGMQCSLMVRHANGPTILTPHGEPTEIEQAILEQSADIGRIFQFKSRLAVNYNRVSIIAANMPDEAAEPERAGQLRDDIAILAETTEALCDNVDMRQESMRRAEQLQVALGGAMATIETLRNSYLRMMGDTRLLLQELVENVERRYSVLDTNQAQEIAISATMDESVQRILALLDGEGNFDRQFDHVLEALRGGNQQNEIELF